MSKVESAAVRLLEFLQSNVGTTEDWPVGIRVDEDYGDAFIGVLNELQAAIKEMPK